MLSPIGPPIQMRLGETLTLKCEHEVEKMREFLKGFSATQSQWKILDAILRSLRAQPELAGCSVPCITFKQVAHFFQPVTPGDLCTYSYEITRSKGEGFFRIRGREEKIVLTVFCEQTYADYLPGNWESSYLYDISISYRLPDGIRRVIKLNDLDAEPVVAKFGGKRLAPKATT